MLKQLCIALSLCFLLSACEGPEPRKYAAELKPYIHKEFIKQGICHEDKSRITGDDCDDAFFVGGGLTGRVYISIHVPTEKFLTFDYSAILNKVNEIYIRDNANIDVIFYNGAYGTYPPDETFKVSYSFYKEDKIPLLDFLIVP